MHLQIPEHAAEILYTLNRAGHEAYIVGGCVRDALLGRTPGDWDITTSARPEQVKALFRRTVDTGIQHGTVTVLIKDDSYEVTTYRVDGVYEDGRHPKQVSFTSLLSEDLRRRDFTINAMAYHPEEGLVDLYQGREDLMARRIRAVGVPEDRFQEDALRIMRAIRFAAQLDFDIEPHTYQAIRAFAQRLKLVSMERIQVEITKLLKSDHPEKFRMFYETGITAILFPEFDLMMELPQNHPYHCYTVGEHTLSMMQVIPPDPILRYTALLHDVGKIHTRTTDEKRLDHFRGHAELSADMARTFLRGLRLDNHTVDAVTRLIRYHDQRFNLTKPQLRRAIHKVGADYFPALLQVIRADTMAKSEFAKEKILPELEQVSELYRQVTADNDCVSLKDLAVSGRDLIAAGVTPGPHMGQILEELLAQVLEDPTKNTKEYLLSQISE